MVVGITGGYCSGKSLACSIFAEAGFAHIDVDSIGHEVLDEMTEEVGKKFGEEALRPEGVDRRVLGSLVFGDPVKRRMLEEIVHPAMVQRVKKIVKRERNTVIDAALLVEMRLFELCDFVIGLQVDEDIAARRGMKRDGLSREEAMLRIGSQIPLKEKLQYVDKVIDNSTTVEEFLGRLRETLNDLIEKG